jgi:hypothetical protein
MPYDSAMILMMKRKKKKKLLLVVCMTTIRTIGSTLLTWNILHYYCMIEASVASAAMTTHYNIVLLLS